jgi:hypothetical protein
MKNTKFKAIFRIAGIIALVAVIVFGMIACGGGGNDTCTHSSFGAWGGSTATWHNNSTNVCGDGIETRTCTNCTHFETRSIPCKGTDGLVLEADGANEYKVGGNFELEVANVCIPDVHPTDGKPVTSIDDGAFIDGGSYPNENIATVRIGKNITIFGDKAFYDSNLTTITFAVGSQLETIGEEVFLLSGLTSIEIPASVTSIGESAFEECTDLKTVTVLATTPPELGDYVFDDCHDDLKIKVPAGSVNAYKAATNWSEYADIIEAL